MSVAKVTEITASSANSFEDAVRDGLKRAGKTIRNMQSAWVNEQKVVIRNEEIAEWHVTLKVTFLLDD